MNDVLQNVHGIPEMLEYSWLCLLKARRSVLEMHCISRFFLPALGSAGHDSSVAGSKFRGTCPSCETFPARCDRWAFDVYDPYVAHPLADAVVELVDFSRGHAPTPSWPSSQDGVGAILRKFTLPVVAWAMKNTVAQ